MNIVNYFFDQIYAYCTDFIINLSNIFRLSYYEINFQCCPVVIRRESIG